MDGREGMCTRRRGGEEEKKGKVGFKWMGPEGGWRWGSVNAKDERRASREREAPGKRGDGAFLKT